MSVFKIPVSTQVSRAAAIIVFVVASGLFAYSFQTVCLHLSLI